MRHKQQPDWQPRRWQKREQQRKAARKRLWLIGSGIAVAFGVALGVLWLFAWQRQTSDEQYRFTSSHYAGVNSKFLLRDTTREKVSIEYPLTPSDTINAFIAKEIDAVDAEFRSAAQRGSPFDQPMTQTISYQISHHTDQHLSITIHIKQDTFGAHPMAATRFWTFDKATGQPITTKQLLGNSEAGMRRLLTIARQQVAAVAKQRGLPAPDVDSITAEHFEQFAIANEHTISFPFGAGAIIASSYGEVGVTINVNELISELQHPLAKQLLSVPEPPKPATPPPTPAPTPRPPVSRSGACGDSPCVALTFDDGPGPHTERLLDMLRDRNAKATFFVLGSKVGGAAGTLQRMQREGHTIGNHTWNHPDLTKQPAATVRDQLLRTNEAVKQAIGAAPTTARAPYGAVNPAVLGEMRSLGLASIMWSVDTRDWADRNSAIVCQRAVGNARSGSIILLHDIHQTSVDAVPCIIDGLRKQGFRFITVSELLGGTQPGVNYYSG